MVLANSALYRLASLFPPRFITRMFIKDGRRVGVTAGQQQGAPEVRRQCELIIWLSCCLFIGSLRLSRQLLQAQRDRFYSRPALNSYPASMSHEKKSSETKVVILQTLSGFIKSVKNCKTLDKTSSY